jgi:hypothetical protein
LSPGFNQIRIYPDFINPDSTKVPLMSTHENITHTYICVECILQKK